MPLMAQLTGPYDSLSPYSMCIQILLLISNHFTWISIFHLLLYNQLVLMGSFDRELYEKELQLGKFQAVYVFDVFV